MTHTISHDKALDFILAGNAIFTVKNVETDNRFTFKVTKHKVDDIYFVKVLTNPDTFEFIGTIRKNSDFKHSMKSRIKNDAKSVLVIDYIIKKLYKNELPNIIEIWHEGKCGRCGRRLTVPDSIESGMGPECSKRSK
jgi:hypothetical protein